MAKIAVVVLADADSHAYIGRLANSLETAKEAKEAGDSVKVIFDGAGTRWVPVLENTEHPLHSLYKATRDVISGACAFCSAAFEVKDQVKQAGIPLLSDYEGHPSLRNLVTEGYSVITF